MSEDSLRRAIDQLYDAFSKYPRPLTYRACGCCSSGRVLEGERWNGTNRPVVEVDSPGAELPVRMISPSALADIAEYVPLTAGTIELFKHYLPRLLEIVITDGFPNDWPDLPVQLSRLAWGNGERAAAWWDWPTAERTAVQQFLDALWAERRRGDLVSADETLSGIAMAVPNLQPFLESWNRDPNEDAIATLHAFRAAERSNADEPWESVWWDGSDEPVSSNHVRLLAWLNEP